MLGMRIEQADALQMVCDKLGPGDNPPAHFACTKRLPRGSVAYPLNFR